MIDLHKPLVSVIVPNYNHCEFLQQRFDSVLSQSCRDFEIILLDDCSTDGSEKLLHEMAQHCKVSSYKRNSDNSGSPFRQWQKGLELASGQFVWIAESDDFAQPDFLETLLPHLQNNPTCHLAASASVYTGADGTEYSSVGNTQPKGSEIITESVSRISGREFIWRHMQQGNGLPNASAILIRNNPQLPSLIPSSMRYCGDWVTWIRILSKHDLIYCHKVLNHWRIHPQTTRWDNQTSKDKTNYFWENVHRPEYMKEMLMAMLELRPVAGHRWNTFVFNGMINHYEKIAGQESKQQFLKEMSLNAKLYWKSKSAIQPIRLFFKQLFKISK